jgi:hypothetical protein
MNLEFLLRRTPKWRIVAQDILFQEGDIVAHGEVAEEEEAGGGGAPVVPGGSAVAMGGALGIGSLRGEGV